MDGLDSSLKLQRTSPQPDIRVRAFRLHSPDLPDGPDTSPLKGFTSSNGFPSENSRILRQTSHSSNIGNGSPGRRHETPERARDDQIVKNGYYDRLDVEHTPSSPYSPDTRNSETTEPWSSAVGRATVGGKSGRVIERLQADNDKLRRELKLYSTRADEEQRRGESIRSTLDSLRASNQNLESICDTNRTALARKDRKLEELREDLKNERTRREAAQQAERVAVNRTTEVLAQARREVVREQEVAALASTQYEVLRTSVEQMRRDCERKLDQVSLDVKSLSMRLDEDQERFNSIEFIERKLEHDHERIVDTTRNMTECYREHKLISDQAVASFKGQLQAAEGLMQAAQEEMIATTGRMRQAMNIKKDFKGDIRA